MLLVYSIVRSLSDTTNVLLLTLADKLELQRKSRRASKVYLQRENMTVYSRGLTEALRGRSDTETGFRAVILSLFRIRIVWRSWLPNFRSHIVDEVACYVTPRLIHGDDNYLGRKTWIFRNHESRSYEERGRNRILNEATNFSFVMDRSCFPDAQVPWWSPNHLSEIVALRVQDIRTERMIVLSHSSMIPMLRHFFGWTRGVREEERSLMSISEWKLRKKWNRIGDRVTV